MFVEVESVLRLTVYFENFVGAKNEIDFSIGFSIFSLSTKVLKITLGASTASHQPF